MADVTFTEVLRLAEQLSPEEQAALVEYLHNLAKQRQLTVEEKKALFKSMMVDVGAVLPGYSDRRADWYDDDGR
jgi:hypothetical protein